MTYTALIQRLGHALKLGVRLLATKPAPVLLYHSIDETIPREIERGLHSVPPGTLRAHLQFLKRHRYEFLFVDELLMRRSCRGLAAVTFDDAYKSVFSNALPVLEQLDVPATIFVNGASLEGKMFWRDKIRFIINNDMLSAWNDFAGRTLRIRGADLYRFSKDPATSSRVVDRELDRFLAAHGVSLFENYCVTKPADLVPHPLLAYGNHSHNHYVLSSLGPDEQLEEILRTEEALDAITGIRRSRIFSLPFGGRRDYDEHTVSILERLGFRGMLMSRNRLNGGTRPMQRATLAVIERFMPLDRPIHRHMRELSAPMGSWFAKSRG